MIVRKWAEGVMAGRISIHEFVALTATHHARLYGLAPRKGEIALGADADLVLWNPDRRVTVTASMLHDRVGYTPYEGMALRGWPEVVINRGRVVVEDAALQVAAGSGQYLARGTPEPLRAGFEGLGRRAAAASPSPRRHVLKALVGLEAAT